MGGFFSPPPSVPVWVPHGLFRSGRCQRPTPRPGTTDQLRSHGTLPPIPPNSPTKANLKIFTWLREIGFVRFTQVESQR